MNDITAWEQMTREQAILFHDNELYESLTLRERAVLQMHQDKLCMPFGVFHEAVEKTLGRLVFTHEFGLNREGILAELMEGTPAPTFAEIMDLIPEEKRIILFTDDLAPDDDA